MDAHKCCWRVTSLKDKGKKEMKGRVTIGNEVRASISAIKRLMYVVGILSNMHLSESDAPFHHILKGVSSISLAINIFQNETIFLILYSARRKISTSTFQKREWAESANFITFF